MDISIRSCFSLLISVLCISSSKKKKTFLFFSLTKKVYRDGENLFFSLTENLDSVLPVELTGGQNLPLQRWKRPCEDN
jgi:hypothetical protein